MAINFSNMQQSSSLRLIISSLVIVLTIKHSEPYDMIFGTELQLIHRDHLHGRHQHNQSERMRQMLKGEMIPDNPVAVAPITSGSLEYFVKLMVGTPPQELLLVVDTASALTWVDCKYKTMLSNAPVVFDADRSSSFHAISCSSTFCRGELYFFVSYPCIKGNYTCGYDYSFQGITSAAQGFFANETITLNLTKGKLAALNNTLIGCTTSISRDSAFITTDASGVLALGSGQFSLPTQASKLFGNKFSYCLVDRFSNKYKSSKLFLGPSRSMPKSHGPVQTTKLELKAVAQVYSVYIQSISVGGMKLNISCAAWEFNDSGGGGTVVDSGWPLSYLLEPAYSAVMDALRKPLLKFKLVSSEDGAPADYCYGKKGFNASLAVAMEIGFEGGAKLKVPPSSYFADARGNTNEELTCVGILDASGEDERNGRNLIGNMFQQGHLWEFDIGNQKLHFASTDCVY